MNVGIVPTHTQSLWLALVIHNMDMDFLSSCHAAGAVRRRHLRTAKVLVVLSIKVLHALLPPDTLWRRKGILVYGLRTEVIVLTFLFRMRLYVWICMCTLSLVSHQHLSPFFSPRSPPSFKVRHKQIRHHKRACLMTQ